MLLLRAATEADFDAIAAIVNHYILHTAIHFAFEQDSADDLRASWVQHRARYPLVVAEEDGLVTGYAKAGPFRERAGYAWTPECGLYLRHDRIGRGVGTALYRRLIGILEGQGYDSVMAGIALPNEASVRLHERLGFVKVGHVARAGWKLGQWNDVGFWQKQLAPVGRGAGEIREPVYG